MSSKQLTISDMAQMKRIFDIVCARGAIQASEMETVGVLYNKLCYLLETVDEKVVDSNSTSTIPRDENRE